ncbi:MAG: hypothetical protein D6776_00945 [Planctomycetota bacterium]|nr:MAG: hypothetical protein D6776_00945 [Planctomycetota bacterium]
MRCPSPPTAPLAIAAALLCLLAAVPAAADDGEGILRDEPDYTHAVAPRFRFRRPDDEWRFVDIERQRAALAGQWSAERIENSFRGLVARLYHQGLEITISFHLLPEPTPAGGEPPSPAALVREVRDRVAARPGVRLREAAPIALHGRPAAWVRYEVAGVDDPERRWVSVQIECPVPETRERLVIFVESPKRHWKAARADLRKVLRSFRWR